MRSPPVRSSPSRTVKRRGATSTRRRGAPRRAPRRGTGCRARGARDCRADRGDPAVQSPDAAVPDHEAEPARAITVLSGSGLLATWRGIGHPDHEAMGELLLRAATRRSIPLFEYTVWAEHRGRLDERLVHRVSLPRTHAWPRAGRSTSSRVSWSRVPTAGRWCPPTSSRACVRTTRSCCRRGGRRERIEDFERRYRADPDRGGSPHPLEQRRYDVTVACLTRPRYHRRSTWLLRRRALQTACPAVRGASSPGTLRRPSSRLHTNASLGSPTSRWPLVRCPASGPGGRSISLCSARSATTSNTTSCTASPHEPRPRSTPGARSSRPTGWGTPPTTSSMATTSTPALAALPDLDHRGRVPGHRLPRGLVDPAMTTGPVRRRGPGAPLGGHDLRLHRVDPAFSRAAGMGHDRFEIVVAADSCHDNAAGLARRALGGSGVVIDACAGSAGQARAIGTARALTGWVGRRSPVWTVHTDADSVVPEGWLHNQRRVAECGFAAVRRSGRGDDRRRAQRGDRPSPPPPLRRLRRRSPTRPRSQPRRSQRCLPCRRRLVGHRQRRTTRSWTAVRRAGFPTLSTRSIHVVTSG